MRWNGFLATTIAALLVAAAPAAADTFTVTGTGDDTGSCASGQCTTIRAALTAAAQAAGADEVDLAAGTYQLTQGPLLLTSDITLRGDSARTTTLYAAPVSRVIQINGGSASISNLTVAGGVATDAAGYFGGNIVAASATVTLDHIRSTGGRAYSGGGIANRNGTMTISNSLIDHNSAPDGGGDSGGILNFGGDGLAAANLTITNSTVAFNSARVGGGIMQWGGDQDSVTLQRVTLARNTATAGAPGGLNISQGSAHVSGSIVASNQGPIGESNCAGTGVVSDGFNVDSGVDCNFAQQTDRSDQSPGLDTDLRNYGGETDVLPFDTPSPAENIGGTCSPLDQTGFARSAPCDAGAWEYRVNQKITISDPPSGPTSSQTATFSFDSDAGPDYACRLIRPSDPKPAFSGCDSGITYSNLAEGAYRFEVRPAGATDLSQGDFATFTVDLTAPETTIDSPGPTETIGTDPTFSFSSSEPNARFECSFDQGPVEFTACESPRTYNDLPLDQTYTFRVRALDAANNADATPATRTFTVGAAVPTPTPTPTPTAVATTSPTPEPTATAIPTATATPTATPTPPPVANTSVEVEPESGTVLVKPKGAKTFVPLRAGVLLNGAEIDTRHGVVVITTSTGEKATFYAGLFLVSQAGGITTLTLSEKLTGCPKAKKSSASAAAKKPKTRKLWGDGKGKFRTKGQYSAATVRGTKWLVTDTCTSTITRVAEGVVDVRDEVKKKTFVLRKGKSHTARAKK
ncbi:hypothetical protein OM076_30745 [Solirubrobacter ginsenosidimutans]|uniref:CSLREA domain-containing protein n=1 Tax=Solirubrobacter ginsenosidimutans TaxID=490573 RepID=A0A9X3S600_9ACTN|nr:choice-of-anchor Q domain-containing protein [Solirubrobacter ginsenosidimutans]MDA0164686.1 hypothetical protein [Solirubrobacter ginsenosidimutans]